MAGAEQATGLGFWPKVLLWAGVIAAGALYLGSINEEASRDERAAPPAERAAPALSDAPAPAAGGDGAPAAVGLAQTPADAVPPAAAEMAATAGEPAAVPAAVPVAAVIPVVDTGAPAPGELAEVTPQEAEAFAKAVVSEPAGQQAEEPAGAAGQDEAAVGASRPAAAAAPAPAAEPPAAAVETMEERRARVTAEYEAMRRRAEEDTQRRWQGMGMPSPGMMPYAAYPPGYYPQAPAQPKQP